LKNKYQYDKLTFSCAADNGNLENMKWLYEKKNVHFIVLHSEKQKKNKNLENMKWLLKKNVHLIHIHLLVRLEIKILKL